MSLFAAWLGKARGVRRGFVGTRVRMVEEKPPPHTPPPPLSPPPLQRRGTGAVVARFLVLGLGFACMVAFAALLARATLVPSPGSVDLTHTNLRPGDSIRAYLERPALRDSVKQIGGNLLLGLPFGVLLPVVAPRARGPLRVVVVTAAVMLLVEAAQGILVTGRAFDVDDVLLNTAGALIGYLLAGRRLGRALHPRRRHWWHRWTGGGPGGPAVSSARPPAPPPP